MHYVGIVHIMLVLCVGVRLVFANSVCMWLW